jgi:hypothetical protein
MTPQIPVDQALAALVSKALAAFGTTGPKGPASGIIPHAGMNIPGAGR